MRGLTMPDARWLRLSPDQKLARSRAVQICRASRYRRLKIWAGGQCQVCGYSRCFRALEFHHIDPEQKSFAVCASGRTMSWKRLIQEALKCLLLCANCHREAEAGLIPREVLYQLWSSRVGSRRLTVNQEGLFPVAGSSPASTATYPYVRGGL
jgi:hypothetical protein